MGNEQKEPKPTRREKQVARFQKAKARTQEGERRDRAKHGDHGTTKPTDEPGPIAGKSM